VAKADGIETLKIDNVELLNPNVPADRNTLRDVLAQSTEIATCLPSVKFYESGRENSIASLIAEGLKNNMREGTIIYAAENNNHAAETLWEAVAGRTGAPLREDVQFLNTVIGKMSRVVTDPAEIAELKLATIAPGLKRAFLVEQFNRILVSRTTISDFKPGIEVFIEKNDLLYGHNAIHSLLGFLGAIKGAVSMTELKEDKTIMEIGRAAFLQESGAALIGKYAHLEDELFTEAGYRNYAEDLLERMTNPHLADTVARVTRDIRRKLEIDGRIFGTMQLALKYDIQPKNMALGAMAGVAVLLENAVENDLPIDLRIIDWRQLNDDTIERVLCWLWNGKTSQLATKFVTHIRGARERLEILTNA